MLDAYIIEELKKRERQKRDRGERPRLEIPRPSDMPINREEADTDDDDEYPHVIIIDI